MPVTGPITLRLWGIINPNKVDIQSTGAFGLALMNDTTALEGNFQITGIIPLLAPDSIQFISLTSTIKYSRYLNDYSFEFLPRQTIVTSNLGGQLFLDFPSDYLIDSYGGICNINQDFSFFVNCQLDNNRIFINASNPEWVPEVSGSLSLTVNGIINPDNAGNTLSFIIYNYNTQTQTILGRTYSNLNPASLFFGYDGLLISVNNDQPIQVEVGTYSDLISINMPGPSKQTLTLTPNVLDPSILITPFPLQIELGQTSVSFRITAPRTILLKPYYITWSKTGDSFIPAYAPLRRTELNMRSKYYIRTVLLEPMEYIPVNGSSYPLAVYTNNPPYE